MVFLSLSFTIFTTSAELAGSRSLGPGFCGSGRRRSHDGTKH